ncbi:hypothetical protein LSAT2_000104 [Lamellibrachia satsuma]|nr:hypothetical protein LSAT2_000104 [Lamellibrachia satsuma]
MSKVNVACTTALMMMMMMMSTCKLALRIFGRGSAVVRRLRSCAAAVQLVRHAGWSLGGRTHPAVDVNTLLDIRMLKGLPRLTRSSHARRLPGLWIDNIGKKAAMKAVIKAAMKAAMKRVEHS